MSIKKVMMNYFAEELKNILSNISDDFFENIQEIRIRAQRPLIIYNNNTEYGISIGGKLTCNIQDSYVASERDVLKTLELMSDYSLYAFEEELKNGYITLQGGHRVGLTGKAVCENKNVKTIKYINGMNIRISHQIKGCAQKVCNYLKDNRGRYIHTMIISPPNCGKTTLLRDIIRIASNEGHTIGIVDERSEIAGCFKGIAQNDVGVRTDVLDACPKAEGMIMLLRAMSPQIIAVDEIGKNTEIYAIEEIMNAGIKLICTVHGSSINELQKKPILSELISRKVFARYIVLSNREKPGTLEAIFNEGFENILKG